MAGDDASAAAIRSLWRWPPDDVGLCPPFGPGFRARRFQQLRADAEDGIERLIRILGNKADLSAANFVLEDRQWHIQKIAIAQQDPSLGGASALGQNAENGAHQRRFSATGLAYHAMNRARHQRKTGVVENPGLSFIGINRD